MTTNGFHVSDIESVLRGKDTLQDVQPPKRRTAAYRPAQRLSKRVTAAAQAEVIREAMAIFIKTVYEKDSGILWNVGKDGRIEIPVPWSRQGAVKWGVRRTHAKILAHSMMQVQSKRTPFIFDQSDRRWYLDLENYSNVDQAIQWLDNFGIDAHMWTLMIEAWKRSNK